MFRLLNEPTTSCDNPRQLVVGRGCEGGISPVGGYPAHNSDNEPARLPPTAKAIISRVATEYGLTSRQVIAGKRAKLAIGAARRQAMAEVYEVRRNGRRVFSTIQVARMFGCSDHTTVLSALRRRAAEEEEGGG
mgnify:CR=1 FL=1